MEETKQIQKFDPAQLMQGVRDRIKSTFVSLIPDDQWEAMVKKESDGFFREKEINPHVNNRQYKFDFQLLVRDELHKEAQARMKKYLESPEFSDTWDNHGNTVASKAVKDMFIENSGQILAGFFAGMFQNALGQITSQLGNQRY